MLRLYLQILQDIGSVLRKFLENPDIPDPDQLVRECWSAEPYTLGAYSFPRVGAKPGLAHLYIIISFSSTWHGV